MPFLTTASHIVPTLLTARKLLCWVLCFLVSDGSFARQDIGGSKGFGNRYAAVGEGVELGEMAEPKSPSAKTLLEKDKKEKHFRKIGKKVRSTRRAFLPLHVGRRSQTSAVSNDSFHVVSNTFSFLALLCACSFDLQHVVSMESGSKVDIFAFGMLMYSMCAWKPPFSGHRPLQILAFITLQHRRPSLSNVATQFPQPVRVLFFFSSRG